MFLKQTIISLSLILPFFCFSMEDTLSTAAEQKQLALLMKNFKKDKTLDNQVLSSLESRFNKNNNNHLPQAKIGAHENFHTKEEIIELRTEAEALTQQLAQAESLCKAKHDENIQLQQEIKTIKTETAKIKKEIALHQKAPVQRKQTSPKKKQTPTNMTVTREALGTGPMVTPTNNPTSEDHQKKLRIKKMLFKEHNVKSERELKNKLAQVCAEQNSDGQIRLYGKGFLVGCSWEYSFSKDTFTINTESFSTHNNIKTCLENSPSEG